MSAPRPHVWLTSLALVAGLCAKPPASMAGSEGARIEYCRLNFPPGRPIAEIVWKSSAKPGSKGLVNGKERVLAAGSVALPKNAGLEVMLQYQATEHPESLDQLSQCVVTVLSASKLEFTDEHLKHIKGYKRLYTLNLNETLVSDKSIPLISTFPEINELRLSATDVTGENFELLTHLKMLHSINLYGTTLKKGTLGKLKPILPQLGDLDITGTHLSREDAVNLQYLTHIRNLDIHGNADIDDSCVKYLSNLNTLEQLWITDTKITDKSLPALAKLPSLKLIVVRAAHFWTTDPKKAKLRPGLKVMDAADRCRTPIDIFGPVH